MPEVPAVFARLTKRVQQVAHLVVAGLSNQDIASGLVSSKRTAEIHVENTLAKLAFTSCTDVAVWNVERFRSSG
jgi:serine/threonine-protein kinase PknK